MENQNINLMKNDIIIIAPDWTKKNKGRNLITGYPCKSRQAKNKTASEKRKSEFY